MEGKRREFYMGENPPPVTFDEMIAAGYVPIRQNGNVVTFRSVICPTATASFPQVDFGPEAEQIDLVDEIAFLSSKPGKVVLGEFVVDESATAREIAAAKEAMAYAKGLYPQAWA